eukprot:g5650.t1
MVAKSEPHPYVGCSGMLEGGCTAVVVAWRCFSKHDAQFLFAGGGQNVVLSQDEAEDAMRMLQGIKASEQQAAQAKAAAGAGGGNTRWRKDCARTMFRQMFQEKHGISPAAGGGAGGASAGSGGAGMAGSTAGGGGGGGESEGGSQAESETESERGAESESESQGGSGCELDSGCGGHCGRKGGCEHGGGAGCESEGAGEEESVDKAGTGDDDLKAQPLFA